MHERYSLYISDDLYSLPAILLASVFLFYCPLWSSKNISRLCHLPAPSLSLNITSTEKLCLPSNYFRKLSNLLNNIQVNSWVWLYSGLWLLKQRFKSQATLIPRWIDSQNCISHPEGSYKSQICLSNYWMDTPFGCGSSKSICTNLNSLFSPQFWISSSLWIIPPSIYPLNPKPEHHPWLPPFFTSLSSLLSSTASLYPIDLWKLSCYFHLSSYQYLSRHHYLSLRFWSCLLAGLPPAVLHILTHSPDSSSKNPTKTWILND